MWQQLESFCCLVGALWLCWLLLVLLVKPLVEVLWQDRLLERLHTRAVLITGCDSGFGESLARRLDSLGVPVFAGCLLPQGPGAQGLAKDCSSRLRVLPLDVTSEQQVADAVATVKAELSDKPETELWAVVNNAGVGHYGPIDELPLQSYQTCFEVNTMGALRVTKAFLPLLKKSRGRVVNVGSPLGLIACPLTSTYAISKSALIMFSNVLRMETKKWSISVSTILPGIYNTQILNVEMLKAEYIENLKIATNTKIATDEKAIQYCQKMLSRIPKIARHDISDVIKEMVAACVGRNTKTVRLTGLFFKISLTVLFILPQRIQEIIVDVIYALSEYFSA